MNLKSRCLYFLKPIIIGLIIALAIINAAKIQRSAYDYVDNYKIVSFSNAVSAAAPAVVNIYSQQYVNSSFTDQQQLQPTELGSGVIIDPQGYILTNYHVVKESDQILIALQDGQLFSAQIIGSDLITDLVVLKIEGKNLPVIPQNLDYQPKVGDVALAIGNPYNLGQTVTSGIISATGRSGISSLGRQDFLQTDASINSGNSGGALINTRGELVGINTSEFHTLKNNQSSGISFAIPFKLAHKVFTSIIKDGNVIRGSIGVVAEKLDPLLARLWGLEKQNSIIIRKVIPLGSADKAGVKANDILLNVNGKESNDLIKVMDQIAEIKPGTSITLLVLREGKEVTLTAKVAELVPNAIMPSQK